VFIYNSFNLDQEWHKDKPGTRILLLEPSHFEKHPVSEKVMRFILDQSLMIPDISICVSEFHDVQQAWSNANFIFKKHPTTTHYRGIEETPLSLFPSVQGYFPSFSAYWKRAEKEMFKMDKNKSLFD
jgi:deoxyribodipyrimidine photo-lyase